MLTMSSETDDIVSAALATVPMVLSKRFNSCLLEFMNQLREVFPDASVRIKCAQNELAIAMAMGFESLPVMAFLTVIEKTCPPDDPNPRNRNQKLKTLIATRNPDFITHHISSIGLMNNLAIHEYWDAANDQIRENVWLFLIELAGIADAYGKSLHPKTASKQELTKKLERVGDIVDDAIKAGMSPDESLKKVLRQLHE